MYGHNNLHIYIWSQISTNVFVYKLLSEFVYCDISIHYQNVDYA